MKSAFNGRGRIAAPASGFPRLVRKTALLNLGMVLSCLAIGAYLGRPASLVILLLIVPMGWIIRNQKHPAAITVIWLLCLLPIISYSGAFTGPNTVPVAAALCLFLLYRSEGGRAALWPYRWSR